MELLSVGPLESLRYSELQRVAKAAGLRANLKADKLLKALKQHLQEPKQENGSMDTEKSSPSTESEEVNSIHEQVASIPKPFVTKRRGKRKIVTNGKMDSKERDSIDENTVFPVEKESHLELKEDEVPQGAGSGKRQKRKQNEELLAKTQTENPAENPIQSQQEEEMISTKRNGSEKDTLAIHPQLGKIPQYTGNLPKSGKTEMKSLTPNFKKLHEAHFKKMESISDYIERKNKRIENFGNSINEVKTLATETKHSKASRKATPQSNSKTHASGKVFLLSPYLQRARDSATCTPASQRHSPSKSLGTANRSILSQKSVFSSSALSTIKMNVRFSEATKDNEHKRSLTKTPSRKSPFLKVCTPDSQKNSKSIVRKSCKGRVSNCELAMKTNHDVVTPFKFAAQTADQTSAKKMTFDLKASLSRPLGYRPYRGKLKPWGESKENTVCSPQKDYKRPRLQSREGRRGKHEEGRKQRKDEMLGTRRGLSFKRNEKSF